MWQKLTILHECLKYYIPLQDFKNLKENKILCAVKFIQDSLWVTPLCHLNIHIIVKYVYRFNCLHKKKKNKKNPVWPCIIVDEYLIISITFIFNICLSVLCSWWITYFYNYCLQFFNWIFCILPECGCIHLVSTNKWFILYSRENSEEQNRYLWQLI